MPTVLDFVAVFMRLALVFICLSYLWKSENFFYGLAENFFIGAFAGHTVLPLLTTIWDTGFLRIAAGNLITIIPIILGFAVYARLSSYKWIARYPTGLLTGLGIGLMFAGTIRSNIFENLRMTVEAVVTAKTPLAIFNGITVLVGTITALSYFTYTLAHKGPLGVSAKIGRIFIMICLGLNWAGHLQGDSVTVVQTFQASVGELLKLLGLR